MLSNSRYETFDAAADPPGRCCTWTFPLSINSVGTLAGYDNDSFGMNHGVVRNRKGTITLLDAPNAATGDGGGTIANAINDAGQVTGYYLDGTYAHRAAHGFLWTP